MSAPHLSARLASLPGSYAIAEIIAKREALRRAGVDVIDLSVGEPDMAPPRMALEALARAAITPGANKYPAFKGLAELRSAFADFYARRYGKRPDPEREVLPLLGSKEGLVNLAHAFADADKPVYAGQVGYPVYRSAAHMAGAPLVEMPCGWDDRYAPVLPPDPRKGGVVFVAAPGNPTGATITMAQLEELVAECRRREAVLCFDAAYVELCGSSGERILPFPTLGGEGLVEFHSLSKSLCLAGWRIGFAVGAPEVLSGLARMKSFIDSGVPYPIQLAVTNLLPTCHAEIDRTRVAFTERQTALRAALAPLPIELFPSDASMFCWARLPGVAGKNFAEACMAEGVVLMGGASFGAGGADCFRMSVTISPDRLPELARRLATVCHKLGA